MSSQFRYLSRVRLIFSWAVAIVMASSLFADTTSIAADESTRLMAGAAKVDITNEAAGPVNDRLYARALVVKHGTTSAVLVSIDAVAIGEIGHIKNDFLPTVRSQIEQDLGIPTTNILVNASHCHGVVSPDVDARTVDAIKLAAKNLVPVTVGVGMGHEDRISENRRILLKNGREVDVRHAYSMPFDEDVAEVGPIDPQIGLLRFDRVDGSETTPTTVAVVYNFACHPIQGVPSGSNTGDLTGIASSVIEDNLSPGTIALFLQGCGGDINPVYYKDVDHPRDAESLGNLLGLSTLQGIRKIRSQKDANLKVINEHLDLPRADIATRIRDMEDEQLALVRSLKGTTLNLKTFMPLVIKYNLSAEFPSYYSHRYLHERKMGRNELAKLDADNRQNIKNYIENIATMERLTRNQTNLALLKKHQADNIAAGKRTVDVELVAVRIGDFKLITFPGELTVRIGLNIKKNAPTPNTFVAGYTNGYIYYAPTAEQLLNVGGAQEDSDCILAPEWQALFETKANEMLRRLE